MDKEEIKEKINKLRDELNQLLINGEETAVYEKSVELDILIAEYYK